MKTYNEAAAKEIFNHHNPSYERNLERCDLHGLRVEEAKTYVEKHIQRCRNSRIGRTDVITGKGNHSAADAKLEPAIKEMLRAEAGVRSVEEGSGGGSFVVVITASGRNSSSRQLSSPSPYYVYDF